MIPYDFDYYRPDNIADAVEVYESLRKLGKKAIYYGGGTEFISMSRLNNVYTDAVIDIKNIAECKTYKIVNDELIIGAGLTLTHIAEKDYFPLLNLAIKRIADHTIQDKVTIGGNLNGSIIYREASLSFLVANAQILVANTQGTNWYNFNEYWKSPADYKAEDLVLQLKVKRKYLNLPHIHVKRTKNEKIDYPLLSAVAIRDGDKISIAFSGLCQNSFRSEDLETILNDRSINNEEKIYKAINSLPCKLLDDNNGSPAYRKFILARILEETLEKLKGDETIA